MNDKERENNFWEFLFGRAPLKVYNDAITVPYPTGFTPIDVIQVSESTPIEVRIENYEKPEYYER